MDQNQSAPIYISTDTPCMSHGSTQIKNKPQRPRHIPIGRQQKVRSASRSPRDRTSDRPNGKRGIRAHLRVRNGQESSQRGCCARTAQTPVDEDERPLSEFRACLADQRKSRSANTLATFLNCKMGLVEDSTTRSLNRIRDLVDEVLFNNKLCNNMEWRWSKETEVGYETEYLGTTTPQYSSDPQNPTYERTYASIVLSRPLLRSGRYKSSLLVSTFIHELVHCYLFITCGRKAEENDGHTKTFRAIVGDIEMWLDNKDLRLCNMKADLDHFLNKDFRLCNMKADLDHFSNDLDEYVVVASPSQQRNVVCRDDDDFVFVEFKTEATGTTNVASSLPISHLHQYRESRSPSLSSSWVGSGSVGCGSDAPLWSHYSTPVPAYISLQDKYFVPY